MKKKMLLVSWLKRVIPPLLNGFARNVRRLFMPEARPALAEDLRKVGVTAIGIGLVGTIVDSVNIARGDALLVLLFGSIIWVFGVWMSTLSPNKE